MIHHAEGLQHYAHSPLLECRKHPNRVERYDCDMPELPEGEDGKCDWCRKADENWRKLGIER